MIFVAGVLGSTEVADILRSGPGAALGVKTGDRVEDAAGVIRHMLLPPRREREDFAAPPQTVAGPAAAPRREINITRRIFGSWAIIMPLLVFLVLIRGLPALPSRFGG
jgi:hypothetical protein